MKLDKRILLKGLTFYILGIINGYYFLNLKFILIFTVGFFLISCLLFNFKKTLIYLYIALFIFGFVYTSYFELNYDSIYSTTNYNGQDVEVIGHIEKKLDSIEGNKLNLKPILINNNRIKYGKIQIYENELKSNISHGDLVIASMNLKTPVRSRNPGGFSYFNYLKKRNVYSIGNIFEIYKIQSNFSLISLIISIKNKLLNSINEKIAYPVNEFVKALLLGEKSNLNLEWSTNFRKAGANHLLAISGLHIGFITIFLLFILNLFTKSEITKTVFLTIFLLGYMVLTGMRSSVLRATLLVLIYRYFKHLKIEVDFLSVLSIVLFIILLINPYQLFSIGLQLSFLVLMMIISWTKILQTYLHPLLAVSFAAQLGSLPLTAYYFNTLTPAGIITNLWAIPLVSGIVFLTLIHFILYMIVPLLSNFSGKIIYLLSLLLKKGINIMSNLPSAEIKVVTPSVITVFLSYIILFSISYIINNKDRVKKYNLVKYTMILLMILLIITLITPEVNNKYLEIYCLDVGQGDSIFIKSPENIKILIDTAGKFGESGQVKRSIIPFLLNKGVRRLDYLFITHFDSDHCSDAEYLIEKNFVKNLIISTKTELDCKKAQNIVQRAKDKKINVYGVNSKDFLTLSDLNIDILAPVKSMNFEKRNNNSIVFTLQYDNFEMLFTGDIEEDAEQIIIENNSQKLSDSDLIKIAHHGSITSSSKTFLEKISPLEAIISVGNNNFGHPDRKIINRLKKLNSRVWRTDENGAIIIKTDGNRYSINGYLN